MFGVHIWHLIEGLEPPLVDVMVHCPVPPVENLSLSLEVKWDRGVDFRTYLVIVGVFPILVIGLLHRCTGRSRSINKSPVVRWLILFAISTSVAAIILVIVLRSYCRRVDYTFHSSQVANSALLIGEPGLGGVDSRGHDYSLTSFLAQGGAWISLCRTWRTSFRGNNRSLLVLHD